MDYDTVFTIEHHGSKGWQVISTHNSLHDAITAYRRCLLSDYGAYRLTSPINVEATYQ
jgi:hypothetical protein